MLNIYKLKCKINILKYYGGSKKKKNVRKPRVAGACSKVKLRYV